MYLLKSKKYLSVGVLTNNRNFKLAWKSSPRMMKYYIYSSRFILNFNITSFYQIKKTMHFTLSIIFSVLLAAVVSAAPQGSESPSNPAAKETPFLPPAGGYSNGCC
ncbi:unnamed protein product [Mucor hiemalis]